MAAHPAPPRGMSGAELGPWNSPGSLTQGLSVASPGARFGRKGRGGKCRALTEQKGAARGIVSASVSAPEDLALGQVSTTLEEGEPQPIYR